MRSWVWIAVLAMVAARAAGMVSVGGVRFPASATVAGEHLLLNGAGMREFLFFDVYAGALYLPRRAATARAALTQQGAYRLVMVLRRDISHARFANAWLEDLRRNSGVAYARFVGEAERFTSFFPDARSGDRIDIDYVPGRGVRVVRNGRLIGTVHGHGFHRALLRVYLGPHPPSERLKRALLGASP